MFAGSYERLWTKHAGLDPAVCDALQNEIPGYSLRMQEVTASALLPQVARLPRIHKIHVANWDKLRTCVHGTLLHMITDTVYRERMAPKWKAQAAHRADAPLPTRH